MRIAISAWLLAAIACVAYEFEVGILAVDCSAHCALVLVPGWRRVHSGSRVPGTIWASSTFTCMVDDLAQ